MPFELWTWIGPRNNVLVVGPDPPHEGAIFGKMVAHIVKYRDFLLWAVQKRLNRSICRLGCRLRWAEGSTSSIVFAKWRQCAHMGGHIGATWRIWLNRLSAAAMRSYVKLFWPLVIISESNVLSAFWTNVNTQKCPQISYSEKNVIDESSNPEENFCFSLTFFNWAVQSVHVICSKLFRKETTLLTKSKDPKLAFWMYRLHDRSITLVYDCHWQLH